MESGDPVTPVGVKVTAKGRFPLSGVPVKFGAAHAGAAANGITHRATKATHPIHRIDFIRASPF
jgi:hypothetical protein